MEFEYVIYGPFETNDYDSLTKDEKRRIIKALLRHYNAKFRPLFPVRPVRYNNILNILAMIWGWENGFVRIEGEEGEETVDIANFQEFYKHFSNHESYISPENVQKKIMDVLT